MTRIQYMHMFGWIVEIKDGTALVLWDNNPHYHTYTLDWIKDNTHAV